MAATLADVAARAGVSSATVSRVLNGNYPVAESTRRRVMAAVADLDYVVNAHARALAAATSDVLGVVVNDISDPFFGVMAGAVQGESALDDLLAVICSTAGSPAEELRYIGLLLRQRVRAIVLTGGHQPDSAHFAELQALVRRAVAADTRVVLCGRPALPDTGAVALEFDDFRGAQALTRYLLSMGHRRIACITGPAGSSTTRARLAGHLAALAEAGVAADESLQVPGGFDRTSGFEGAQVLLDRAEQPTAIVAANDLVALGVLAAARERDIDVPGRLSVTGYDDISFAVDAYPALTTVRLPLIEAGRRAGRIAAGREAAAPGAVVSLRPELIVRDSVAAPRSG
ncbi:LacI family DNA-binding transcriptional regulator [Peterkaempfera sp. SMS 1(5)a]|uniref:LacI family DNA-binding transcriptional regulator n=1 Tax=Peterkaempfera podocarpi TaxID=3232308 RepID=UPI00366E2365